MPKIPASSPRKLSANDQQKAFEELCRWIDLHLDGPIGWQELMQVSGLDFQTIQHLFFRHASTSPMTWIRRRRTPT